MKLYQMNDQQRIDYLLQNNYLDQTQADFLRQRQPLTQDISDGLSENQIGMMGLPYGFATDFLINGQNYLIPMVTEEPSVVAAASNGAKRIKNSGGFTTKSTPHIVYGQIVLENVKEEQRTFLISQKDYLMDIAHQAHPSLERRGGGITGIDFKQLEDFLELQLSINTVDAMGANIVNSILEKVSSEISKMIDVDVLCSILSNSGLGQVIEANAEIEFDQLKTKTMSGEEVAQRIVKLTNFSKLSVKRAITHNKGIMNGIDAVLLATGNDYRAQEAAAHSFSIQDGKYQPFTDWQIVNDKLVGKIRLPIEVGSVGGAISALPMAQISLKIMKIKNSQQLQSVIACVGLANNLSALRALVTTGIQAGHMSLQSKSLAISAGAMGKEIDQVAHQMNLDKQYSLEKAKEILTELRNS